MLLNILRICHALIEPCSLLCNAGGCRRTFSTYKALRQHLTKQHAENSVSANKHPPELTDCAVANENCCIETLDDCISDADIADCTPCVDEFGVSQAALKFLLALVASNSLPLTTVNFIRNSAQELVNDILSYFKKKCIQAMESTGIVADTSPVFRQLLDDFDR